MLFRFSLYGFLKNQRYFEPFLYLAFLDKGLSFFQIGLLIGIREICTNVMEIPSGAAADIYGKKKAMLLSFAGYIASFALLALGTRFVHFLPAMLLFSVGEAFRTGTHKAIILDWLRATNQADKQTKVYGITRSWSKAGSAVSACIAAALVFYKGNFTFAFWLSICPYLAGIVNLLSYPKDPVSEKHADKPFRRIVGHLFATMADCLRKRPLRRLMEESAGFNGLYATIKDYIQPILKSSILVLPFFTGIDDVRRIAVLSGASYLLIHLLEGLGARLSHRVAEKWKGEENASVRLWYGAFLAAVLIGVGLSIKSSLVAIGGFMLLALVHNAFRPILVTRYDAHSDPSQRATLLSVDAQAKSLFGAVFSPILGYSVDLFSGIRMLDGISNFLPVAVLGVLVTGIMALRKWSRNRNDSE